MKKNLNYFEIRNKHTIFALILINRTNNNNDNTNMKKILFLVSILALAFASCGNPQGGSEEQCDSIMSKDLAFYRLHGKVHKVSYAEIGLEYEFDENGTLISFMGQDPYIDKPVREVDTLGNVTEYSSFKKDKDGQIIQILGVESVNTYTWEDGLVIADEGSGPGMTWSCSYEHDKYSNASYQHATYYDVFNKSESSGTTTYTILLKDEHGNWLERSEKYIPDTPSETNKETAPRKQTRTITYY